MDQFPNYQQLDSMDCGPTCLRIISKHYGKNFSIHNLRKRCFITRTGVSLLGISDAAESLGFRSIGVKITFNELFNKKPFPCILHWDQNHFVVCYDIKKKANSYNIKISDPCGQKYILDKKKFLEHWKDNKTDKEEIGLALILNPTPNFYSQDEEGTKETINTNSFIKYIKPYKNQIIQIIIGLIIGSFLSIIFPFLTQSIVDQGIFNNNLNLITLILIAQFVIFVSQLVLDFLRNWIILHINTRISIALISDFLIKLMKLRISFFDKRNIGDIMQRIDDNYRIKSFLTGSTLMTIFSLGNFIIFSGILAYYNINLLICFIIGNSLYIIWTLLFLKSRRKLDFKRFHLLGVDNNNIVQIVTGMQDIKLNNYEKKQRWKWEETQVKLFNIETKELALGQYQQLGSFFFSQITSLIISFFTARSVIEGNMTLGMMMSVSYIIAQLSIPISQAISFIQTAQDAKISFERINEINNNENEENTNTNLDDIPIGDIIIRNLFFSYDGADRNYVLENVNLIIPCNKITAIVGASGSGKTTLMKLLLGFYTPNKGSIKIGHASVNEMNPFLWRNKIGAVMQDGFIYSDTIINNIVVGTDNIDRDRLQNAVRMSNINEFIESLPLKYETIIGSDGNGLSKGQHQRLLIARAIYKNPEYFFLDEATNALDANNEKIILQNLNNFYTGKTVIIVAHRLSTIQNADNIVVLGNGQIIEQGNHCQLIEKQGAYYQLVKSQLEL